MSDTNEATNGYPLVTTVFKHEFMAGKSLYLGLLCTRSASSIYIL